jgi:hypothetical protein
MADHTVNICNSWNGNEGNKVTFQNPSAATCCISQIPGSTWPFKEPSPITVPGGTSVNPGTASTHLKNGLADGTYSYNVDCCTNGMAKSVTVP